MNVEVTETPADNGKIAAIDAFLRDNWPEEWEHEGHIPMLVITTDTKSSPTGVHVHCWCINGNPDVTDVIADVCEQLAEKLRARSGV